MTYHAFLIKYAEIGIKGKNRHIFEDALIRNMESALKEVEGSFSVSKESGRIYVTMDGGYDYEGAVDALARVFGIAYICPVVLMKSGSFEELRDRVLDYVKEMYPEDDGRRTFKVFARRGEKRFPMNSMEIAQELGSAIWMRARISRLMFIIPKFV